ncbi:unnamed protein product [Arabidopsis halleri]
MYKFDFFFFFVFMVSLFSPLINFYNQKVWFQLLRR